MFLDFLNIKNISLILLNITFMTTFLTIFFFTYGHKIEEQVTENQMKYITNNLLDDFSLFLTPDDKKLISENLQNIKFPDMSASDNNILENNKKIMYKSFKIVLAFLIFILLLTLSFSYYFNFSYREILFQSLLALVVVTATEFTFLTVYGSKLVTADANFVKLKIIETIEKNK